MGLALDEPTDEDETVVVGDVSFIVDDDLLTLVPPGSSVTIDYDPRWRRFFVSAGHGGGC